MSDGFEHTTTIDLAAPPARVFRALSDGDELRAWFASDAAVDARLGGTYHFWGSATLGAPSRAEATQTLTHFEAGRALAFAWTLQGVPTEVSYRVTGDGDASKLEVRHAIRGALPYRRPDHVVSDLWRILGGNLGEHLRGSGGVVLPDFSSGHPEVRASIEIAAPPAKVWRALTEPALLDQWLGGAAKVDLPAGAYSYGWTYEVEGRRVAGGPTRIIEMVEHHRQAVDAHHLGARAAGRRHPHPGHHAPHRVRAPGGPQRLPAGLGPLHGRAARGRAGSLAAGHSDQRRSEKTWKAPAVSTKNWRFTPLHGSGS
jgi:uncharacterized protein YndB with AHSA1/START domain